MVNGYCLRCLILRHDKGRLRDGQNEKVRDYPTENELEETRLTPGFFLLAFHQFYDVFVGIESEATDLGKGDGTINPHVL